jgi:phage gp36-like protein
VRPQRRGCRCFVNARIIQRFKTLNGKHHEQNRHDYQRVLHVLKDRANHNGGVGVFKLDATPTERIGRV